MHSRGEECDRLAACHDFTSGLLVRVQEYGGAGGDEIHLVMIWVGEDMYSRDSARIKFFVVADNDND